MFEHDTRRWIPAVLETATDGILVESAERVVFANAAYAELLGYRRATDLVYRPITEFISGEDEDRLLRFSRMRLAGQHPPSSYAFSARRSDATSIRLQASVSVAVSGGTQFITTIVRPLPPPDETLPLPGPHDALSPRERQVMDMLLAGIRAKTIAHELNLTENTVATHRMRLMQKLGVGDARELFQYAIRQRLVHWT